MDAKLQDVILEYGMEGYGLYWYCLEMIASNVSPDNLTFELEHDSRIIARNTGLGVQKVQEIMTHFVNINLFDRSEGRITCLKLAKRADDYTAKIARAIVSQATDNKEVLETPTNSDKILESPPRLDKIRLDKKRKDKQKRNSLLSENFQITEDMESWFKEQNFSINMVAATEKWKDSMKSTGKLCSDWLAAWRNGMRIAQGWADEKMGVTGNKPRKEFGR